MSRRLMAIFVSTALVFGSVATNALSAPVRTTGQTDLVQASAAIDKAPLPAGHAAGIKQAQAMKIDPLIAIAVVAGVFLLGVLLIGDSTDDDDETAPTTGTF